MPWPCFSCSKVGEFRRARILMLSENASNPNYFSPRHGVLVARVGKETPHPRPRPGQDGGGKRAPCLEAVLQGKLQNARRHRAAEDSAETDIPAGINRRVVLGVVPNVVELGPELQAGSFRDLGVLDQREIPVVLAGPHDCAHLRVPEAGCTRNISWNSTGAISLDASPDAGCVDIGVLVDVSVIRSAAKLGYLRRREVAGTAEQTAGSGQASPAANSELVAPNGVGRIQLSPDPPSSERDAGRAVVNPAAVCIGDR